MPIFFLPEWMTMSASFLRLRYTWGLAASKAKAASETTSDFAACATLLNQAHKNIEILGKLTGELTERPSGPSIAIQIVVPAGAQVPSFAPGPADDGITYDVTGEEIGIKTRS